jgi:hypothetical protein
MAYLPTKVAWFRLPEYVQSVTERVTTLEGAGGPAPGLQEVLDAGNTATSIDTLSRAEFVLGENGLGSSDLYYENAAGNYSEIYNDVNNIYIAQNNGGTNKYGEFTIGNGEPYLYYYDGSFSTSFEFELSPLANTTVRVPSNPIDGDRVLALSVNGTYANSAGDITLATGGSLQAVTDIGATTTNNMEIIGTNASLDIHNVAYNIGTFGTLGATTASIGAYTPNGDVTQSSTATESVTLTKWQGAPDKQISIIATASNAVIEWETAIGQTLTLEHTQTVGNFTQTFQAVTGTVALKDVGYTVATLPAGTVGDRAYVTDATGPTYLGTLTGGGAVTCPVFYNGAAWVSA